MRSRQFESFNSAIQYLSSQGTLKYWGRIGHNQDINLYTYKYQGIKYRLYIYTNGFVELRED